MSRMTTQRRFAATAIVAFISSLVWGCALPNANHVPPPYEPPDLQPLLSGSEQAKSASKKSGANQRYAARQAGRFEEIDEPPVPNQRNHGIDDPSPHEPLFGTDIEDIAPGRIDRQTVGGGRPMPIDLANALAMGGADHPQILLARERVIEAAANFLGAKALWLPSLRFGVGWNKHDGRLQATEGPIGEFDRNSLFVGGGAGLGSAPLAGGSGGPARLFVNLSLADAIFEPWIAERALDAEAAGEAATVNDALLHIALAYHDLVEAHGMLANAEACRKMAEHMVRLTTAHLDAGAGAEADVDRAKVELALREQGSEDARRRTVAASAALARQLRLGPHVVLLPAEENVVPVNLIDPDSPLEMLVAHGLSSRPELDQYAAMIDGAAERSAQEFWRPWLPNLQLGASGGTFGGGDSANFDAQGDRSDIDVLAVWEVRNLGYGVMADRRARDSQWRQAELKAIWVRDGIIQEITTSAADVASYRRQILKALKAVTEAGESYQRNRQRVIDGAGSPIELLQAIRARCTALDAYTRAVSDHNRAQFRLLRALGQPPGTSQQPF